jgi:hypothetical protein
VARRDPEAMLVLLRDRIDQGRRQQPNTGLVSFSVSPMGTGLEA